MSASEITCRDGRDRWIHGHFGTEPPYKVVKTAAGRYAVEDSQGWRIRLLDSHDEETTSRRWIAEDITAWLNPERTTP